MVTRRCDLSELFDIIDAGPTAAIGIYGNLMTRANVLAIAARAKAAGWLVIVGGLIFSQLITLFVTPVIYLWLEWFQEHVLDKVPFLRRVHAHPEAEPAREEMQPAPAGVH